MSRANTDGVPTDLTCANVRLTGGQKESVPRMWVLALTAAPLEGHAKRDLTRASANQVWILCLLMPLEYGVTVFNSRVTQVLRLR